MLRDDQTCPKCGALTTPQLVRCRQCGHYLHGSRLEGVLVETLLPKGLSVAPGTGLIVGYIMMTYAVMVLLAGPESLAGFRPIALLQLGSTVSTEVQDNQPWRFISSVFAHGSLLHVAFNLYALTIVGPLVERIHCRKRVVVFFVLTGAVSMFGSYVVGTATSGFFPGSVGASGAISGLIGLSFVQTRGRRPVEREAHPTMRSWALLVLMFGFLPGVDGFAHGFGLLAGAFLGWLVPPGPPQRRIGYRIWTAAALFSMAVVLGSSALTIAHARGQPYRLKDDAAPIRFLFFTIDAGTSFRRSGQYAALSACVEKADGDDVDAAIDACTLATRALPHHAKGHFALAEQLERAGRTGEAKRRRDIAERLR